jgi:hypothetical protein
MDWEKEKDRLWYGIWSRGPRPNYFLGLYTSHSMTDGLSMWAQVLVDGDHTSNLPVGYNSKLSGREDAGTSVVFTMKISPANESSGAIEGWFIRSATPAQRLGGQSRLICAIRAHRASQRLRQKKIHPAMQSVAL